MSMMKKYENFIYKSPFQSSTFDTEQQNNVDFKLYSSRLYEIKSNSDTHFILIKSIPTGMISVLRHYYLAWRDIEWHPGSPNDDIYTKANAFGKGTVHYIYELCSYCADNFLCTNIERDINFHIVYFNCDSMLSDSVQTTITLLIFINIIYAIIMPMDYIISFSTFIILIGTLICVNNIGGKNCNYIKCQHIK